jgi:hypothetical protein
MNVTLIESILVHTIFLRNHPQERLINFFVTDDLGLTRSRPVKREEVRKRATMGDVRRQGRESDLVRLARITVADAKIY